MAVWTAYAAVFSGDATGATDVTDALREFLESNDGGTWRWPPTGCIRSPTWSSPHMT